MKRLQKKAKRRHREPEIARREMADRQYPPMVQELGLRCSWVAPARRFVYALTRYCLLAPSASPFAHALTQVLLAGPVSESVRARSLASLSSRLLPALRSFTEVEGGLRADSSRAKRSGEVEEL